MDDARVQRDTARAFACLTQSEEVRATSGLGGSLPALFKLARSLDVACQRYATLSLCNVSCGEHKAKVVSSSVPFDRSCSSRGFPTWRFKGMLLSPWLHWPWATTPQQRKDRGRRCC